jgi:hypothetical protein
MQQAASPQALVAGLAATGLVGRSPHEFAAWSRHPGYEPDEDLITVVGVTVRRSMPRHRAGHFRSHEDSLREVTMWVVEYRQDATKIARRKAKMDRRLS